MAPPKIIKRKYLFKPPVWTNKIKIPTIIININIVKILYKLFSVKEKSPNAIPSFQIKLIFKYLDVVISEKPVEKAW